MLEKQIEKKVCDYAKKLGWLCYKGNSDSVRGYPDRIFFKNGVTVLIEFKREGGKLSGNQKARITEIRSQQIPVFVVWNVEDGITLFDAIEDYVEYYSSWDIFKYIRICVEEWMPTHAE